MQSKWIRKRRKERRRARKTRFGITMVVSESGPPCPRCKQRTEVREHKKLGERQRQTKFYFARWYRCRNPECRTTLIMPEQFKVWNYKPGGDVALDVLDELVSEPKNLNPN
jgi:hypothetical protein